MATVESLKMTYDINMKVLGSGSYGKVFLAENRKDKSIHVAIKVIKKTGLSQEDLTNLEREVTLMQTVDHPNIVKYYETYIDVKFIYLVMELCRGGELFSKIITKRKPMTEREASKDMAKLVRALLHCHS